MTHLTDTAMLTAGPLSALLHELTDELAEDRELAPGSPIILTKARLVKRLETALETASMGDPWCDSHAAAHIMGVGDRQARKLAREGKVEAVQAGAECAWRFSVRSCHAYAQRRSAA